MSVFAAALARSSSVSHQPAASAESVRACTAAWLGTSVLLLAAPFEARQPLVRLPGQSLSSVETVLLIVFAIWLSACAFARRFPDWRTPLTAPWLALIAVSLVAALASPERTNAVHMTGRLGLAFGVFLVAVNGATTTARLRTVVTVAAVAGGVVTVIVLLEYANLRPVLEGLRLFRQNIAHVGAQVRAGGPFQYPTIASMYLEIAFALALGLLLLAIDAGRSALAALVGLLLVAMAEAVTLTFTRAGLLTLGTSLGVVCLWRVREHGMDRGVAALAALALMIACLFVASRSIESLRLRMTTEGQNAWYHATIEAPDALSIPAGGAVTAPVTVTNSGYSSWDPTAANPFRFSYHWLLGDADRVVSWEGVRTEFPNVLLPGESVTLPVRVVAPLQPGNYRVMWDIEQEDRLWFSTEPDADLFVSRATVSGQSGGLIDLDKLSVLPTRAVRPGRLVLWSAAVRMFVDHPLLGVGPDNFRLLYGSYARLAGTDPRVHSNNMYLEVLAGGGLAVAAAFGWLAWSMASAARVMARRATAGTLASLAAGVLAATVAIAVHGVFDSFLSFTGTYIPMAIALGLLVAVVRLTSTPEAAPATASAGFFQRRRSGL